MQLHLLPLPRQLQVFLSIERDIELHWYELTTTVKAREAQSKQLRAFLVFGDRLRPYLNEEDTFSGKHKRDLEKESGGRMDAPSLAIVRQGTTEVLRKLRLRYAWKPNWNSRREICRVNWVARLSAMVRLARKTTCLFADDELRRYLREDEKKILGAEIMDNYKHWFKLEKGDGMAIKGPKIASQELTERINRKYEDYTRNWGRKTHMPRTPANLGAAAMTPGLPVGGAMTPGLMPGTPGVSGQMTPGYGNAGMMRAPTPNYQSGIAPKIYEDSGGNTPQWKPPQTPLGPMTPSGVPSSATPLPGGIKAVGTPAGPPPPTPIKAVGTPAGPPPPTPIKASGTPAGPPPPTPMVPVPVTPAGALVR